MKIPTYEEIKPYIEKKLVSEQVHPENENIRIFNYTQHCQFEKAWDDVTRQCRGLIMDVSTGEVIARPFPKFFNYSEHVQNMWPIPNDTPIITEKLDGSLGILYYLGGKPWIATRGSFISDQAQWATKWFRDNCAHMRFDPSLTYLFEIIYPENRIVVNYDFSGLVLLTAINTKTGETEMATVGSDEPINLRAAKQIAVTNIEELAKMDTPNSEGFVVFYPKENVRMKIKFPEYVRLHKIITGISEIGIWEMLRDGADFAPLIDKVPDEFFQWVTDVKKGLIEQFELIELRASTIKAFAGMQDTRKKQAEFITKESDYPGVVFAMLDGKDHEAIIWKMIRPHGKSIFKTDIDA